MIATALSACMSLFLAVNRTNSKASEGYFRVLEPAQLSYFKGDPLKRYRLALGGVNVGEVP